MLTSFGRIVLLAYYTGAINEQRESNFFEEQFTIWREGEERWAQAESPAELRFLICSGLQQQQQRRGVQLHVGAPCHPPQTDRQTDSRLSDRSSVLHLAVAGVYI